jgi:hypothetical protein
MDCDDPDSWRGFPDGFVQLVGIPYHVLILRAVLFLKHYSLKRMTRQGPAPKDAGDLEAGVTGAEKASAPEAAAPVAPAEAADLEAEAPNVSPTTKDVADGAPGSARGDDITEKTKVSSEV